tara:strand:- start:1070 stop:1357 length:288 start_codon:yes stop_codon:yes gene_type:complete
MSAHTPGPWHIVKIDESEWQITSDARDWCVLALTPILGGPACLSKEDEANAHLIAAAPDLLNEGKKLIEALKNMAIDASHFLAFELAIVEAGGKS